MRAGFCFTLCSMLVLGFGLPAHAQESAAIDVSLGDVSLNKVAFLVAKDNGIYKKYGLDIHQFITAQAANRIKRSGVTVPSEFIGSGDRDAKAPISVGGGSPLIVSMTTDARVTERVIVSTTDSSARFHIIASPALKGVDDLKGKRLGYSVYGSVSHLMALALLRQKKWSPDDDISLMSEGMAFPALKDGKVDAFIGSEIYYTMAEKNGAKDLVDLSSYNIPIAGSGVNVERKWLAANKDTTSRFLKAMIEAYARMKADKGVVRAALAKWYNISDTKQQEDMYAQVVRTPKKPYPAADGIKLVMELFTYHELKRHKATDFYDASFVEQLDKSGFIDGIYTN
ncbi:MAG TPA: ABC transporter substrate-binding protein [Alphaproteobacteria bacterium]|nr:ABC transporter substrate-binding protein [Alphaproteobacteria bacterium]